MLAGYSAARSQDAAAEAGAAGGIASVDIGLKKLVSKVYLTTYSSIKVMRADFQAL